MKIRVIFSYISLMIISSCLPLESRSQLAVVPGSSIGMTPLEFVQTYLVGTGVVVSNATYDGSSEPLNSTNRIPLKARDEIGSFTNSGGAATQLGINGGVILSTGYVTKAKAGLNPNDDMWGSSQPAESDPDLVILAGGYAINDKSVLEFDFVPQTDVITFRYVFGSIEFDGFCSSINDAFGLFLSGPGIAGGLGFANNAVNIALLPNSANYVNIFNICAADQGNLGNGVYSWWNVKKDFFSYNRLTYVFSATYTVVCNQTYHMKFAIGDASDGVLDSGVFLEQNSFSSNNVVSSASFSNPLTGQLLVEGCGNASLVYSMPQAQTTDVVVDLAIHPSGTATQADVLPNPFPLHATIPAGQLQSAPILIVPVPDGITEPTENLIIKGTTLTCNIPNVVTNEFFIKDYNLLSVDMNNSTICDGSSATLTPVVSGGQQIIPSNTYNYIWSTAETTASIVVTPPAGHHLYSVTVTDACYQSAVKEISVDVGLTPGPAGPISGTNPVCTPATGLIYSIPAIAGADSYVWTLPAGTTITSGNNTNAITVDFNQIAVSGTVSVLGHNIICGDGVPSTLNLVVNPSVPAAGPISGPSTLCQGVEPVIYSIEPLAYASSYDWSVPTGVTILSGAGTNQVTCVFTTSAVSGNLIVRGFNAECGYGLRAVKPVVVKPLPGPAGSVTSINGSVVCTPVQGIAYNVTPITNVLTYNWSYSGSGVTLLNNGALLLIDFSTTSTSGILTVEGENGCGTGPVSPIFPVTANPKPVADFLTCNDMVTTKNGRPIVLKGGRPIGTGGVYTGTGVSQVSPGVYVFDPANSGIVGGGAMNSISYTILYRYTNIFNCFDEKSATISVYGSNAGDPCPGTVKDHRDNQTYPTFLAGTSPTPQCWTAANLNYGNYTDNLQSQTENCLIEKYCKNNFASQCDSSGAFYQWGELMQYQETAGYQDICMPGWHVATIADWDNLTQAGTGNGGAGSSLKDLLNHNGFHGLLEGMLYQNSVWAYNTGSNTGTMFWTSGPLSGNYAAARGLNIFNPSVSLYPSLRSNAFPVRCVRN